MISKKHILWTFLGAILLAMLTGIGAVVLPNGWIDEDVLFTIFIAGLYALGGLVIIAVAPKQGRLKWTLRICAICLPISMLTFIASIWILPLISWSGSEFFYIPASVLLTIGIAAAHRLMILPLKSHLVAFRVIKRTALISAALTAMIIIILIVDNEVTRSLDDFEELLARLLGVSSIIAAGSTIATGIIVVLAPKPGEDEQGTLATSIPIDLACPRCQSTIHAQSNKDSRCPTCKLKVRVQIEEPRCVCGYLLYQLQSTTCPECGKPIPESEQWGSGEGSVSASTAAQSASDDQTQTPSS